MHCTLLLFAKLLFLWHSLIFFAMTGSTPYFRTMIVKISHRRGARPLIVSAPRPWLHRVFFPDDLF
jgi:hypothetical protein